MLTDEALGSRAHAYYEAADRERAAQRSLDAATKEYEFRKGHRAEAERRLAEGILEGHDQAFLVAGGYLLEARLVDGRGVIIPRKARRLEDK
jgi:hypothetical protein